MAGLFEFFLDNWPALQEGLVITLSLTFTSLIVGFIIGITLALGRIYGNRLASTLSVSYIEVFRGTPLLTQIFILYYGLPTVGLSFDPMIAAFIGFSLNSGAYQAEYIRGAIQSIESGQMIAARSMGMSKFQSIRNIILPQGLRISLPAWSNELIYLFKYTSIAYVIRVEELTAQATFIGSSTFKYLEIFAIIAVIYLIFTIIFTEITDRVEKKYRIPGLGYKEEKGGRTV